MIKIYKERDPRLPEFATFNNLVLTNILGLHKPFRGWTWHGPDGKHQSQTEHILVKKRVRSGVNIHMTRILTGADIRSDYDPVMMTFRVCLKKARKPNQPRLRVDLEKLEDPDVPCTFQATMGGKIAPLSGLRDEDIGINSMITIYNTAVTDAASEILGKGRSRKKHRVTRDVLDLCDERRDLKKKRYEEKRAKEYRKANKRIWRDNNISLGSKVIFLYACESWTLTAELEKRKQTFETRCYRRPLNIAYKDHVTNEEVHRKIQAAIGEYEELTLVKKQKLRSFGHVSTSSGLAKTILQGTMKRQTEEEVGRQCQRVDRNRLCQLN